MKGKKTESRIISKRVNSSAEARKWLDSLVDKELDDYPNRKAQRIESFGIVRDDEGLDVIVIVETVLTEGPRLNIIGGHPRG